MTERLSPGVLENEGSEPYPIILVLSSDIDNAAATKFMVDCDAAIMQKQKDTITKDDPFYDLFAMCWDAGSPYGGAIGGFYSYVVSYTSIGVAVKIRCGYLDIELDITDYSNW